MDRPPRFSHIVTIIGERLPGFRCPQCDEWLGWLSQMNFRAEDYQWWECPSCDWLWHGPMTRPFADIKNYFAHRTRARAAIQEVNP